MFVNEKCNKKLFPIESILTKMNIHEFLTLNLVMREKKTVRVTPNNCHIT